MILITSIKNWTDYEQGLNYQDNILKSFFYLRFLILYLTIDKLIEFNKLNFKLFFYSCAFFVFIIGFDVLFQFFFKINLIGIELTHSKPSSFFNEEQIAGGYLQRFFLFFVFIFSQKYNQHNFKNIFLAIIIILFFSSIVLTGNRMPGFMFVIILFLYFIINKKIKNILLLGFIFIIFSFLILKLSSYNRYHSNLKIFLKDSVNIVTILPKLYINNDKVNIPIEAWRTGYLTHFNTGLQIWKKNKIFGNGLKSFKNKCTYNKNQTCNTHPHNYFIEILVDTGLIGIFILYTFLLKNVYSFFKFYYKETNINFKFQSAIFFLLIFAEFFPIRSTGSFFTTGNSIYIFLIMSFFINAKKIIENKRELKEKL